MEHHKELIDWLKSELPAGARMVVVFRDTAYIRYTFRLRGSNAISQIVIHMEPLEPLVTHKVYVEVSTKYDSRHPESVGYVRDNIYTLENEIADANSLARDILQRLPEMSALMAHLWNTMEDGSLGYPTLTFGEENE